MKAFIYYFTSMKSAIAIIAILTVLSAIGTLIPQNLEFNQYLSNYPTIGNLILKLEFNDIYHSYIYMSFLALLAVSTVLCTTRRFIYTSRLLFGKLNESTKEKIKSINLKYKIKTKIDEEFLKDFTVIKTDDKGTLKCRKSGTYALIGALILHIGLVFILAGGYYGLISGCETYISGSKGEKVPIVDAETLRIAMKADKLRKKAKFINATNPNNPELTEYIHTIEKAKILYNEALVKPFFSVIFNDLKVTYHDENHQSIIKNWISDISFSSANEQNVNATVTVNNPITYKNYTFYQAAWGKTFSKIKIRAEISPSATKEDLKNWNINAENFPLEAEMAINETNVFSWCNHKIELIGFYPDLKLIEGRAVSISNELNNPAAQIIAHKTAEEANQTKQWRAWAFPNPIPGMEGKTSNMPLTFYYVSAVAVPQSTLTVKYDPGENIMWLGCLLLSLGMILCFSGIYKEEWILIDNEGITIAVSGNRAHNLYINHFEKLKEQLQNFKSEAKK